MKLKIHNVLVFALCLLGVGRVFAFIPADDRFLPKFRHEQLREELEKIRVETKDIRTLRFEFTKDDFNSGASESCEDPAIDEFVQRLFKDGTSFFELILMRVTESEQQFAVQLEFPFPMNGLLERTEKDGEYSLTCMAPLDFKAGNKDEEYLVELEGWMTTVEFEAAEEGPNFEGNFTLWVPDDRPKRDNYCYVSFFTQELQGQWRQPQVVQNRPEPTPSDQDHRPQEDTSPGSAEDSETEDDTPRVRPSLAPTSQPTVAQDGKKLRPFSQASKAEPKPQIKLGGGGCTTSMPLSLTPLLLLFLVLLQKPGRELHAIGSNRRDKNRFHSPSNLGRKSPWK